MTFRRHLRRGGGRGIRERGATRGTIAGTTTGTDRRELSDLPAIGRGTTSADSVRALRRTGTAADTPHPAACRHPLLSSDRAGTMEATTTAAEALGGLVSALWNAVFLEFKDVAF